MFDYNNFLQIPDRLMLNKKLTKAFFLKNFDLSAAEKKLLNQKIVQMQWLARINSDTANIPIVTGKRVYEEIQIMLCSVTQLEEIERACIELFQKYIPYQILLFVEDDNEFVVNTCDKRVNLNDSSKRTIEGYFTTAKLSKLYKNEINSSFLNALKYDQLDKTNLETLYKSYNRAVVQHQTANLTGNYSLRTQSRTKVDMQLLLQIEEIEKEIVSLSSKIKKATQLNERVNLNVGIQKKRKDIDTIKDKLRQ
jgi:hypothetical protein